MIGLLKVSVVYFTDMNIKELIPSLKINILNVNFAGKGTEWNFENMRSPFSRLYLITEGEAYVNHDGEKYYLKPGTIHLIPCFSLCNYKCYKWFKHYYIHFTGRLSGDLDIFNIGKFSYQLSADKEQYKLFEKLNDLCEKSGNQSEEQASMVLQRDAIMRLIICPFLDTLTDANKLPPENFIKVLDYIDKNLHKPLTLTSLAQIAALHPNYFSDQFNNIFAIRPIDYLNRKRIDKAQIMILSNLGTMKEIAYSTGFKDIAYFSRIFSKYSGVAPSQYKDTMLI